MRMELTLPALERLLGGDTEIEVGVRRQVVEEFAKRHLKAILNDQAFKAIVSAWHVEIQAAVAETMKSLRDEKQAKVDSGQAGKEALGWRRLRDQVEETAATAVEHAIRESTEKWTANISRIILREVHKQMEQCVDAELATRVKDRTSPLGRMIEDEVEARIRERLDAAKNLGPVIA